MLQIREFTSDITIENPDERTFTAIAVPYDQVATLPDGTKEMFSQNSVEPPADGMILKNRHNEPIGKILEWTQSIKGLLVKGKISKTAKGDECYELLKDRVFKGMSIGYDDRNAKSTKDFKTGITTILKAIAPEVSLALHPVYSGAMIGEVREQPEQERSKMTDENKKEEKDSTDNADVVTSDMLQNLREEVERGFDAKIQNLATRSNENEMNYTAGSILKKIVDGDKLALRAYTGATSSETVADRPGWVGDLTRFVTSQSKLIDFFNSAPLPKEGNNVEYAQLASENFQANFGKQAAEGDDLAYAEFIVDSTTASVGTYGGYSQLTRQQIERSSVNVIDANMKFMAIGAGAALKKAIKTHFATAVTTQVTAGNKVVVTDLADLKKVLDGCVDGAVAMDLLGLALEGIVADKTKFKALMNIQASDGRPLMMVSRGATGNTVGTLNVSGLTGELANIPVILEPSLTVATLAFANSQAITSYLSPTVQLSDETITNLTKTFSVYEYAAFANEIPAAIIPITAS